MLAKRRFGVVFDQAVIEVLRERWAQGKVCQCAPSPVTGSTGWDSEHPVEPRYCVLCGRKRLRVYIGDRWPPTDGRFN